MFKKNYDHLPKETYFGMYKEATRGNPNYFLTYGNGKSAARIQHNLRPNGAHRWHNYMKSPKYGQIITVIFFFLSLEHIILYCLMLSLMVGCHLQKKFLVKETFWLHPIIKRKTVYICLKIRNSKVLLFHQFIYEGKQ